MAEENGVWRTIRGRRVFIKDGQSLTDAMKESGKFQETAENNDSPINNQEKYGVVVKLKDGTCVQIAQYVDLSELQNAPFGIRTLPSKTKRKYLVGSQVPDSYDWDHEEDVSTFYTDKRRLNGASTLDLWDGNSPKSLADVGKRIKQAYDKTYSQFYKKNLLYGNDEDKHRIIFGDGYEYGEDPDELIVQNPKVWGVVYRYKSEKDVRSLDELGVKNKSQTKKPKSGSKNSGEKISSAEANENYMAYRKQLAQKYDVSLMAVSYQINEEERKKLEKLAEIRRKAL